MHEHSSCFCWNQHHRPYGDGEFDGFYQLFGGLGVNIEWRGSDGVDLYLEWPWFYHGSEQLECHGERTG